MHYFIRVCPNTNMHKKPLFYSIGQLCLLIGGYMLKNNSVSGGMQGRLWERYQIYLANTSDNPPKSFDQWLNS